MPGLTGMCGLSGMSGSHGGPYHEKILDYNPIVLFPLWEAAGAQADEIANGWNGTHVGVTLGQPGLGDGYTSPWYDGAADCTNIFTAGFQAAFALYNDPTGLLDESEGTILIWAKVANVGVWTDGLNSYIMNLYVDVDNRIRLQRDGGNNNQLILFYEAGNVIESQAIAGITTVDWMCLGITWSKSTGPTGEVRFFYNGVQQGATATTLGVWAGNLFATHTVIGAFSTAPTGMWHGWLAYGAVFGYPITPAGMAELGTLVGGVL